MAPLLAPPPPPLDDELDDLLLVVPHAATTMAKASTAMVAASGLPLRLASNPENTSVPLLLLGCLSVPTARPDRVSLNDRARYVKSLS
jgi:hypothetical protein